MQELGVGLIVAFATWSILVRYTPNAIRHRVRQLAARALRRLGLGGLADRIGRRQKAADCSSGCGSCGGCGPAPRTNTNSNTNTAEQSSITTEALHRSARSAETGRGR